MKISSLELYVRLLWVDHKDLISRDRRGFVLTEFFSIEEL